LDKGKTIFLEEQPTPMVEQSSNIKKTRLDLSTKSKTQISARKRKKHRSGSDVGKVADIVPEVIVEVPHEHDGEITESIPKGVLEIPQEEVGEIAENTPEVIVKVPKEKGGEEKKTLELRVKSNRKFRVNKGSTITHSSNRNTRSTP
jgi:hypothetical protein